MTGGGEDDDGSFESRFDEPRFDTTDWERETLEISDDNDGGEDERSVSVLCRWHDRDIGKNNLILGVFETHEDAVSHLFENYDVQKLEVNTFEDTSVDYQCHYYIQLWNVAGDRNDDQEGVRGRQEIQKALEDVKEKALAEPNPPRSSQYAARLAAKHRSLRWVLGEVDDL